MRYIKQILELTPNFDMVEKPTFAIPRSLKKIIINGLKKFLRSRRGSNPRPSACKADVITTTLQDLLLQVDRLFRYNISFYATTQFFTVSDFVCKNFVRQWKIFQK